MAKTVDLKISTTQEVVSAITNGLEHYGTTFPCLINLHDLSQNGIILNQREVVRLVENIRDTVKFSVLRGSISSDFGSVSYGDERYFVYERLDGKISSNNINIRVNSFTYFKFYVSENNWIDIHFTREDGSLFAMVLVP